MGSQLLVGTGSFTNASFYFLPFLFIYFLYLYFFFHNLLVLVRCRWLSTETLKLLVQKLDTGQIHDLSLLTSAQQIEQQDMFWMKLGLRRGQG